MVTNMHFELLVADIYLIFLGHCIEPVSIANVIMIMTTDTMAMVADMMTMVADTVAMNHHTF